eukprot:s2453_g6.t3
MISLLAKKLMQAARRSCCHLCTFEAGSVSGCTDCGNRADAEKVFGRQSRHDLARKLMQAARSLWETELQEVLRDAQIAATVQVFGRQSPHDQSFGKEADARCEVFGRQSRHEQPFRKEADASCEARLLPSAAHFEAGRVFWDAQIATTVHVFGRLHRHDSACKEADASCEVLRRQHLHVQPFRKEADASCEVFGRQSRHDQPFCKEADASCEARLLPSVAPFEAGSVSGCTDCGNRAGAGCCQLLHPLKQEVFRDAQIAATVQVFGRQSPHDQPFRKEADASCEARLLRRGCCHLLHPLKQEVIRDAQIAATVQVFGRQSPHDQPFCKEADASCEARLLPSVAPFEAGSVSGMHRLRQPCRRGCCHLLHPLKQEVFRDAQIAATVQARLLPSVAPFEAGSDSGCTDCGNRAGAGCCQLLHPLKQEVFRDAQIAATVQVFGRQSPHDQPFRKEADASCEARLLRRGCCHLLHPLKQEVIRDAQIAATVQVFGRQSPHDQPFCKEADASCEARKLMQAARSLEDRVLMISLSARKLMQAARHGTMLGFSVQEFQRK